MSFVLIEFAEDEDGTSGGVAVVAKTWLTPRKKEVFWPPIKEQKQFNKILKRVDVADPTWKLYKIERCFYETDDYEKAQQKLRLSEVTSDLASDQESLATKRRRIKSRRFSSSSDEEVSELNRPPPIKTKIPRVEKEINKEQTVISRTVRISPPASIRYSPIGPKLIPGQDKRNQTSLSSPAVSPKCTSAQEKRCINQASESPSIRNSQISRSQVVLWQDDTNSCQAQQDIQSDEPGTAFEKKILSTLIYVREQNNQILSWIKQSKDGNGLVLPNDMPANFPLQNIDDVGVIENYLENKNNLNSLCSYFSNVGGRDLTSQINHILKRILSDDLASRYSFYGKRAEKQAFADLRLRTVVTGAINKSVIQGTEKEIEAAIKVWLKHAPDRLKNRDKRRQP